MTPGSPETTLTRHNSTFDEWYVALKNYAHSQGSSCRDAADWYEGYAMGNTPAEEWLDMWSD